MSAAPPFVLESTADVDRHGDGWRGKRAGVEGEGGWPLYVQRFAEMPGR